MDKEAPLKRQLPYPYNQDLSKVLRHLHRRTDFSRVKLANEPATAALLAAAIRLVDRHIGPNAERNRTRHDDEQSVERPLLDFLSGHDVAREAAKNPHPFPRASYGMFRTTWETQADFIADLISFGLWSAQYPSTQHDDDVLAAGSEELVEGENLVRAVHALAYWDSSTVYSLPSFRLGLVAALAAEGDPVILEAVAESYRGGLAPWKQLYAEFLAARELQLRPGLTVDDLASLLSAMAEGVLTRAMGDPTSNVIDHGRQRSLLGTGALAVIYACLERAEDATGLTLEQAVQAMVYDRSDR